MFKASFLVSLFLIQMAHLSADTAAPASVDQGFTQTLVMVGIALAFFYFILWRPEQKRRKTLEAQRSSMKKGDRVNCMGLIGSISKINKDTVIIRTGDAEVEFLKAAVSEILPNSTEETKE
jgi:preprotein translocase subunit YajC